MKKSSPVILLLFFACIILFSQEISSSIKTQVPLELQSKVILIKGESNLNHWESIVDKVDAKLILNYVKNTSSTIDTLFIKIKVTDILSGRKKMDRLTHRALKAVKHPYITFFYTLSTVTNSNKQKISGNLTIAGITKKITTQVIYNEDKSTITLKGIHKLDMTDYGVKPPRVFLGILKTRKDIAIDFTLSFNLNYSSF